MTSTRAILLFVIAFLGFFLRIYALEKIPPGLYSDEAYDGVDALISLHDRDFQAFYTGNNGREGLFIALQAVSHVERIFIPVEIRPDAIETAVRRVAPNATIKTFGEILRYPQSLKL